MTSGAVDAPLAGLAFVVRGRRRTVFFCSAEAASADFEGMDM
jgi:hypothetical protein